MARGKKTKRRKNKAAPIEQTPEAPDRAERPTDHRLARGVWAKPQGAMKSAQPFVDMASDAVGRLHHAGLINNAEEQAARQFQAARQAYLEELPDISGFKSCIAGGIPGYDDGDGDPRVIEEYRRLEKLVGLRDRSLVIAVCEEGHVPSTWDGLVKLKGALWRIARPVDARKKIA